jgi:hypothetical protein
MKKTYDYTYGNVPFGGSIRAESHGEFPRHIGTCFGNHNGISCQTTYCRGRNNPVADRSTYFSRKGW